MPWDEEQLKRTLILQRTGMSPNTTYRIHPYMRVTTKEGETFMEPFPSGEISVPHQGIIFTWVEFIEPPSTGDGDTNLTRDTNDCMIRLTDPT